jgi:hypothetical protein
VALALLFAVGLAACGGGDSSSSTTTEADQVRAKSKSGQGASNQGGAESDEGKAAGGDSLSGNSSPGASDFTPQHHNDSGGGSAPLRTKGGDNSVQEFGEEADMSELDEAAAALHDFLDARAESNWAAACEYMSKSVVEGFKQLAAQSAQVEDSSCAGILQGLTNPAAKEAMKAEAAQADVHSLRADSERAFVIYTANGDAVYAMPMANEGGAWKVASLAGTPLN